MNSTGIEKNNKTPFITIILPTRDRPQLAAQALDFILKQDLDDYEVIISDNGYIEPCFNYIKNYLSDPRFYYKRSPYPMNMSEHWNFAIKDFRGKYVAIISERFFFRPDAFSVMKEISVKTDADIMTWQIDYFDSASFFSTELYGEYHPLVKPGNYFEYSSREALENRLEFKYPSSCRKLRNINHYGMIYSGCIKGSLIKKLSKKFTNIFSGITPDYTSMVYFSLFSKKCIDINQSLMLLATVPFSSNGRATKYSAVSTMEFLKTYELNFDQLIKRLPIANFWIGHNILTSYDILKTYSQVNGYTYSFNRNNLAFFAHKDILQITEWGNIPNQQLYKIIGNEISAIPVDIINQLESNYLESKKFCVTEVYHSCTYKLSDYDFNTSPSDLARLHYEHSAAPPRKPIFNKKITAREAMDFFYEYNNQSLSILGVDY